ncbi:MAG: glycosyltransferase family 39 protein [Deltaproteobacteria bacterium]|nr:glycosyltransferase family 39 protein [Deltaproteobacteria bacterium]
MPALLRHLRAGAVLAAAGALTAALIAFQRDNDATRGWWLILFGLLLGMAGQAGVAYPAPPPAPPPLPTTRTRRWLGLLLAAAGAALWTYGVLRLTEHWASGFDIAWLSWVVATALMGIGADLAWGRWPRGGGGGVGEIPPGPPFSKGGIGKGGRVRRALPWVVLGLLMVVAALYRLGNIADFPGEASATQIEDFQVGNFGHVFLQGERVRWEYLSSTWLAALGIAIGGHSQLAVRVPFALVSVIKLAPMFIWTRLMVGTAGALVGTALLAPSFWDVVLSRIPNNHNALTVAIVFALLAGPVRRGRPSAFIVLGFLGGYILHEYIAYRPLVAWSLAGATWWSLRDPAAGWPARLARPLLTVVLIASLVAPLFITRLHGPLISEYTDGWARARGQTAYYNPQDTVEQGVQRRLARATDAAELFVWQGDRSPVRNMKMWPLVSPVTAVLLLLGIAGALVHALRPVLLLTLAGFIVHVLGTLVATGNFDVARVGGSVAYVYPLAGVGAAGVIAALAAAWGRWARWLAGAALGLAAVWSAWAWDTPHLLQLWSAPEVRRAHRNELAFLTVWVRDHVRPGERVVGIAPLHPNAIKSHDGSWLMPDRPPGRIVSDVESALRDWLANPVPTLLFVYVGRTTEDVAAYLHWLFPSLEFRIDRDPLEMGDDVASVHVEAPPPDLAAKLAAMQCRGADAVFILHGPAAQPPLARQTVVVPFIDRSVWPDALMEQVPRLAPQRLTIRFRALFRIEQGGEYRFGLTSYAGTATLRIDGERRDGHAFIPANLTPGVHELTLEGEFALVTPSMQLRWSGPDTQNRQELMPLYRIAEPRPNCPPEPDPEADSPQMNTENHG